MGYTDISTALIDKVATVTGLAAVYEHEPKELKEYPCATITAISHENVANDTAANKRQYTFAIRLFYRTDDPATAEATLKTKVDALIAAVEADVRLGGACDLARPTGSKWMYLEREIPLRVCEITIQATKREVR